VIGTKLWGILGAVTLFAMQQDCASLVYDLNTIKGTVVSYLKKKHGHSKQNISKLE